MLAKSSALLFPLKLRYTNELVIDASKLYIFCVSEKKFIMPIKQSHLKSVSINID